MKAFLALGAPLAAFAGSAALFVGGAVPPASAAGTIEIKVLSSRADLISGGDALVQIVLPAGVSASSIKVDVNGRDVTSAFAIRPNGNFEGFVTGLADGPNVLRALKKDRSGARITITNHPIGGPVLAGPQVQPYICGTTLGPPQDAQCNAPTRYTYYYRSTNPTKSGFQPYDPQNPPSDVATTTTDQGAIVPYIVRVEDGTADRGYYQIAVLFNPNKPWTPWAPQDGWNHKVWVSFGGDCKPWHQQPTATSTLEEKPLSRGFAVANSGQNKLGSDCNDVVSAEALMMLKEHLTETYGAIRYTMSDGCSGGSMQQHWIASNYPGLLDGIQPLVQLPRHLGARCRRPRTATSSTTTSTAPRRSSGRCRQQQDAVTGLRRCDAAAEPFWDGPTHRLRADVVRPDQRRRLLELAAPRRSTTRRRTPAASAARSRTTWSSIFGRRASDGFANRPYDNVGVQYGLARARNRTDHRRAVRRPQREGRRASTSTGSYTPARSVADPAALDAAYRAGRVDLPARGREGADHRPARARATSRSTPTSTATCMRARLDMANGNHDNQVIWTERRLARRRRDGDGDGVRSHRPLADRHRRRRSQHPARAEGRRGQARRTRSTPAGSPGRRSPT